VNPLEGKAQRAFLLRHGDMVNMVPHQTVGPNSDSLGCTVLGEKAEIDTAIGIVEKSILFTVAALGKVIGEARNKIARSSSHDPSVNPGSERSTPGFFKGLG
jgi:hypothetical protein